MNFAHTFGHALESVSDYAVPHGSAVAIGMIIANEISVRRKLLSKEYANRIKNVCNKILKNISIESQWRDIDNFVKAIRKDKKQINKSIRAVLLQDGSYLSVYDDISAIEIQHAVDVIQ